MNQSLATVIDRTRSDVRVEQRHDDERDRSDVHQTGEQTIFRHLRARVYSTTGTHATQISIGRLQCAARTEETTQSAQFDTGHSLSGC